MIKLHDKYFEPFISKQEIDAAIDQMVENVKADFKEETPIFICVLNGAFMFASDFIKKFDQPCEISFVKLSSYHGFSSTGIVKTLLDVPDNVQGRSVVILEDIIDTGKTVKELVSMFSNINVKKFKIASMFYKPEVYSGEYNIDYVGIEIPNKFIVGYGLDYDELGRNLPEVYQIKEN